MKYLRRTKPLIAIFAALLLVPLLARLAAVPSLRENSHIQQARIYRDAGRFYSARAEYLIALKQHPLDIALHDEYITAEIQHARLANDMATIRVLHKRYSDLWSSRAAHIKALQPTQTDPNKAKKYPPDPELAVYLYNYGVLRAETGGGPGINEGFALFGEARYNNPTDPCIRARLAMMCMASPTKMTAAWGETQIKIAITDAPSRARNYEELFSYYVRTNRQKEALAVVAQARANTDNGRLLAEEAAQLHLSEGNVLRAMGEYLRAKMCGLFAAAALLLAAIVAAMWIASLVRQSPIRVVPINIFSAAVVGIFSIVLAQIGHHLIDGQFGQTNGWIVFEKALRSGLIDEAAKFLVIGALIWKLARIRNVAEGMIIGATVGGIFAVLNALIVTRGIGADAVSGKLFALTTINVCGGAIAGFFAAREKLHPTERPLMALAGLMLAIAFHAAFVVASEIGVVAAEMGFVIVACEVVLMQWLFGRAILSGDWPGRLDTTHIRMDVTILLGLALATFFSVCFAILSTQFRSGTEIFETALPHLLRAGFVMAMFCLLVRKTQSPTENLGPRLLTR